MTHPYPRFTGEEPCAQVGHEWFFTAGDGTSYKDLPAVVAVCESCPMREPCLEYALNVNMRGIWGGTTEADRKRIRKARNIIPLPITA